MDRTEEVKVSRRVFDGLEAVRSSGLTNMFDVEAVKALAIRLGHLVTVDWIETHKKDYINGIFNGFEIEEKRDDDSKVS